jgi:adenylosuccinate lyase
VLAEAIQTVLRRHGVPNAYEKLKGLTRGQRIDRDAILHFVDGLPLPDEEKRRLRSLTPASYIGNAASQARRTPHR